MAGFCCTLPLIVITSIYFVIRLDVMYYNQESNVQAVEQIDGLPIGSVLNFTLGEPTSKEDFYFRILFNLWDHDTYRNPQDLDKIGVLSLSLESDFFDVD